MSDPSEKIDEELGANPVEESDRDETMENETQIDQQDQSESLPVETPEVVVETPEVIAETPAVIALELSPRTRPPAGIRRADGNGRDLVDAMAGRASVYGFDQARLDSAWQSLDGVYLGDGSTYAGAGQNDHANGDRRLQDALHELAGDDMGCRASRVFCVPSPAEAIEWAIAAVRGDQKFRTLTLAGSDHGHTGVGRTASGRVELQSGYGPLVAGFTHVRGDDVDSIRTAIDDQTTAILLSPMHLHSAGQALQPEFLIAAREICDAHDLALIIDQTQWTFGAGGAALAHHCLADVDADIVLGSAGLFGGIPGAIVIANDRFDDVTAPNHPFHCALATSTIQAMHTDGLIAQGSPRMDELAIALAEIVSEFDFVRDLHAVGSSLCIECDLESSSLVSLAAASGLRWEAAGDTSVRMQFPLMVSDDDWNALTERLQHVLSGIASQQAAVA